MNAGIIGLWIGLLDAAAAVFFVLSGLVRDAEKRDELEALLARGRRLSGVLDQVGPVPNISSHPHHRLVAFGRHATFVFETPKGPMRVETDVSVPVISMHLFHASSRYETLATPVMLLLNETPP